MPPYTDTHPMPWVVQFLFSPLEIGGILALLLAAGSLVYIPGIILYRIFEPAIQQVRSRRRADTPAALAEPSPPSDGRPVRPYDPGRAGLRVGICANLFVLYILLPYTLYVPGSNMGRPIALFFEGIIPAVIALCVGLGPSVVSLASGPHRWKGALGCILNLLPFPLFWVLLGFIFHSLQLITEP